MLHVALHELAARRAEDVFAQQVGSGHAQRHRILQLVPEAEGAAGLVQGGARPHATAQHLVDQPAVHEQVERIVGRLHLDGAERDIPCAGTAREGGFGGRDAPVPGQQGARMLAIATLPEGKADLVRLPGRELDPHLVGSTGIESRTGIAGQCVSRHRRRARQRAVPPQEGQPVRRGRVRCIADAGERDARAELLVVGIGGKDRPEFMVQLGDDVQVLASAWRPQSPLGVAEYAESTWPAAPVREGQERELHRVLWVHEHRQFLLDPM